MKLIRINELMAMTGLSMSTLLRMERRGKLPNRRKISTQAMGWLSEEIEEWMKNLPNAGSSKIPDILKTNED